MIKIDKYNKFHDISEQALIAIVLLFSLLKFFFVDYTIAALLNWETFSFIQFRRLRYLLSAFLLAPVTLSALLCIITPLSLLPKAARLKVIVIADFILSIAVLTDILYLRFYTDLFSVHDIILIPQAGEVAGSVMALLRLPDILVFSDLMLLLILKLRKKTKFIVSTLTAKRVIATSAVMVLAICLQIGIYLHLAIKRPMVLNAMYDRLSVCAWLGTATFHFMDIKNNISEKMFRDDVSPAIIAEISDFFEQNSSAIATDYAKGKNVIFIQWESLQNFAVGLKINGIEVTPNLNAFMKESVYFDNVWNQTAAGQSSDCEFMVNSGLYTASFGAAYTRFPDNDYNTLAFALRGKGYHAVVIQGTHRAFWNCHRMHPSLGFEKQYSRSTYPNEEIIGLGLSDKVIFEKAAEIFEGFDKPFYGFIVTLTSHYPFDFDGIDDGSFVLPENLRGTIMGNYLLSLNYTDKQLGLFLKRLRSSGLIDKSIIAIYGDHPAIQSADKKELEQLIGIDLNEQHRWLSTRKIPLMFRIPTENAALIQPGTVRHIDTGQIDILPTVSSLLGIKIKTAFGKDLFGNSAAPVIFRNGTYISNGILVNPSYGSAADMKTGQKKNTVRFTDMNKQVEKALQYNDLILKNNLIKRVNLR